MANIPPPLSPSHFPLPTPTPTPKRTKPCSPGWTGSGYVRRKRRDMSWRVRQNGLRFPIDINLVYGGGLVDLSLSGFCLPRTSGTQRVEKGSLHSRWRPAARPSSASFVLSRSPGLSRPRRLFRSRFERCHKVHRYLVTFY